MGEVIQLAKADGCDLDPDLIEIKLKQTQSMALKNQYVKGFGRKS